MKKVCFMIMCLLCFGMAHADLNDAQTKLRDDLMQFLSEEGFRPSIDDDGDIKFKKEGSSYYITVNENDVSPMYVMMASYVNYPDGDGESGELITRLAATELNRYKAVKVVPRTTSAIIRTEMYLQQADAFKYAFYKMLSQLQSATKDFSDEYAKSKKELAEISAQ